ncbi:MAG: hypothetical protein ISS57_09770 [Anaerolineales bacterium]|nr:hypothetical protein [Anaerolineales bacterium]
MMKTVGQILWILIMLLIAGCSAAGGVTNPTETSTVVSPTSPPTETFVPTATSLPPVGVLLASPEADPELVDALQNSLSQSIPEAGLRFQVRPSLSPEIIAAEDIHWVIALPPAPGLGDLVSSSPEARFLAVGVEGLESAPNLSMIGAEGARLDQQGFIAGYMAALITPDWRVGVISVADSEAGQLARRSFITGAKFYCGFCSPTYPPFFEYPLYIQLNAGADAVEWQAAADFLLQRGVSTFYVVPGAGDDTLLGYLARSGVNMIGGETPPENVRESWVATVDFSDLEAFYSFWPEFVAGADGQSVSVPIGISDINSSLLSPGKQRLVEEVLVDIQAGFIELVGRNVP